MSRAEVCPPGAITGRVALLVWGVPLAAIGAGMVWSDLFLPLAIPAFAVMGGACVANAARCGRVHCYATGPLFLGMAAFLGAVALGWAPAKWVDEASWAVVGGTALAYAAEWLGRRRYAGPGARPGR